MSEKDTTPESAAKPAGEPAARTDTSTGKSQPRPQPGRARAPAVTNEMLLTAFNANFRRGAQMVAAASPNTSVLVTNSMLARNAGQIVAEADRVLGYIERRSGVLDAKRPAIRSLLEKELVDHLRAMAESIARAAFASNGIETNKDRFYEAREPATRAAMRVLMDQKGADEAKSKSDNAAAVGGVAEAAPANGQPD